MQRLMAVLFLLCLATRTLAQPTGQLEAQLLAEGTTTLAPEARLQGDAARGAIVFHQPHMACVKCHTLDGREPSLGPDLTKFTEAVSDEQLVEAVLLPSKVIRKGYEPLTLLTTAGDVITGLKVETSTDEIALRDPSTGRILRFSPEQIEQQRASATSIMPAGQVNQLGSRQQFLDLVRYLMELRDGGPARAKELQPAPALYALQIPEYESRVDHAGLIRDLDDKAFERGREIYERLCINCHGTLEQPGSLPTALRFGEGKFKSGSDPYAMYRTLTYGFGFMVPQTWMVPRQKYDVIHYIREAFLKSHNPSQLFAIDETYLAGLPAGNTRGPKPVKYEPWSTMDYGPQLVGTYEVVPGATAGSSSGASQPSGGLTSPARQGSENFAYKGIAVRLDPGAGGVAQGRAWMIFDHDTMRMAAAWTDDGAPPGKRFIDWQGIHFDGRHQAHPHVVGDVQLQNPTGPGWANPATGTFDDDARVVGRDGKRYGPLPHDWARYEGFYVHEGETIVKYAVGGAEILERPGMIRIEAGSFDHDNSIDSSLRNVPVFTRTFNIGPRRQDLTLLVTTDPDPEAQLDVSTDGVALLQPSSIAAGLSPPIAGARWQLRDSRLTLTLPAGDEPLQFMLGMARDVSVDDIHATLEQAGPSVDLAALAQGGRPRWPEKVTTAPVMGDANGPFAVDVLTAPMTNPWPARMRLSGLDFFPDGDRMAVCAWDGDVWLVEGLAGLRDDEPKLTWQRIASGLFQPLGLKIVDGQIYVTCRDQIVILRDLNGDGETDFYECFNNDQQVTEHFHEFAMGLQVDDAGNFYYAKSARHALPAIVPQHGTLLRVSPDGAYTEIIANGFRAANGVCLNPDGTFIVTDQEGHWNPKNRINWVTPGTAGSVRFYGNMFGYHDVTDESDAAMEQPLCWITNEFDRSPAELLWVDSDRWGPLQGTLLNLSYGYGKVYVVPFEDRSADRSRGACVRCRSSSSRPGRCAAGFIPTTADCICAGCLPGRVLSRGRKGACTASGRPASRCICRLASRRRGRGCRSHSPIRWTRWRRAIRRTTG